MRYAVLSDIHANLEALTAVFDALATERIDRYLCLGDLVGYGADPSACLSALQSHEAIMVAGNHEHGCIGRLELGWFNDAAQAALAWTRDRLSFGELDALRHLPLTHVIEPFTLVHGTLRAPERFTYLMDLAQAVDTLTACRTLTCLVGHTHVPCCIEYDRTHRKVLRVLSRPEELAEVAYEDDSDARRYLLNPGSVGQPRDGDSRASVAVIDTGARRMSIRRIPYDVAAAQDKIRQASLPGFLADRLALGR